MATLVTKLQVFIQVKKKDKNNKYLVLLTYLLKEINNSIDDTNQQTVQNFPMFIIELL